MLEPAAEDELAFEVTVIDSVPVMVFRPHSVGDTRWADFHALDLEAPPLTQPPGASAATTRPAEDRPATDVQRDWLTLRDALLVPNEAVLARGLAGLAVRIHALGVSDLQLVHSWDGFQILGRVAIREREARFSVPVLIRPSPENPRHLAVELAAVRLYGFVDVPAPVIGRALADALARALSALPAAHVTMQGTRLEVDLLELALTQFLVVRGWRLPRVRETRLVDLDWGEGRFQLHFGAGSPAAEQPPRGVAEAGPLDGDATEESLRERCLAHPEDGHARLRLLAFRVAARGDDAAALALAAIAEDPTAVPPLLCAAVAAAEAGDAAGASEWFLEAARVADAAGAIHEAELAREAAETHRPSAASPSSSDATTTVDEPTVDAPTVDAPTVDAPTVDAPTVGAPTVDDRTLAAQAAERQDFALAAHHLGAALAALPPTALEAALEIQEQLAEMHLALRDWAAAQRCVEAVLHRDPTRIAMLERLIEIHEQLDRHEEAARLWARLSRLYSSPRSRAEALFREGEIRREILGDDPGASEAYLKSSDSDPTFVPTARRLLAQFWHAGAFNDVASVGEELASQAPPLALAQLDLTERVRLAAAVALTHDDPIRALQLTGLTTLPFHADAAAAALIEVTLARQGDPPLAAAPVIALLRDWEKNSPDDESGDEGHDEGHEGEDERRDPAGALSLALEARLREDLAAPGVARALAAVHDLAQNPARARVYYAFAVFLEPGDRAARRLAELASTEVADPGTDGAALRPPPEPTLTPTPARHQTSGDLPDDDAHWASFSGSVDLLSFLERALIVDSQFGSHAEELHESERRASLLRTPRMMSLLQTLTGAADGADALASP